MKIEIRVFPVLGMSAFRSTFEKSYSARICFYLAADKFVGWAGFIKPNIGGENASMLKIVIGCVYDER
jgi:hypothetical protein